MKYYKCPACNDVTTDEEILEECLSGTSVSNIMHMIHTYNADLIHFKDSSLGLWCIDQNPKDVSKEWIEKNAFQLNK